jgi:hypothetical protein
MQVTVDDKLAAAAATITRMPAARITGRLEELEAEHRRRGSLAGARDSAEVDSLDLDWAAYQLALHHERAGDLAAASRWYKMAAANDFADAALRLGCVLDTLAGQRAASPHAGYYTTQRDELSLVSQAARWYAEAYGAGHPEAAERLDLMIGRHDTSRPRPTPARQLAPVPATTSPPCERGGLDAVVTAATSPQQPATSFTAPPASANSSAAADC